MLRGAFRLVLAWGVFALALFMLAGGALALMDRVIVEGRSASFIAALPEGLKTGISLAQEQVASWAALLSEVIGPEAVLYEASLTLSGLFLALVFLKFFLDFFRGSLRRAKRS